MPTNTVVAQRLGAVGRTLGSLWIVYGVLRLAVALLLFVYSGLATVMFGALLASVPNPFFLMGVFHFFYGIAIIVTALAGIFGLLAGSALLGERPAGRPLALAAALLSVSDIPLGTTLGTYTLVVFLR